VTGQTGADDALMKSFGDEVIGMISCCPYSLDAETESNKRFIDSMQKNFQTEPGFYAAGLYITCMVIDAALAKSGGKTDDKEEFMKTLKSVSLDDTPRGPVKFDHFGNAVGNFFIRRAEKVGGKLVNKTIKIYPNVSQFWTYDEKKFLEQPVYSRDFPPLKS
jgi:branched-chain amino acid transport system substrate-binding protein